MLVTFQSKINPTTHQHSQLSQRGHWTHQSITVHASTHHHHIEAQQMTKCTNKPQSPPPLHKIDTMKHSLQSEFKLRRGVMFSRTAFPEMVTTFCRLLFHRCLGIHPDRMCSRLVMCRLCIRPLWAGLFCCAAWPVDLCSS